MSYYYNTNGTYYVTYTSNSTSTWSTWSGYGSYNTAGYDYTPPNKKKNHELTHLLRKYDGELRQINKMKQALGR